MKEYTEEEFDEFIHVIIPQQLFHVSPIDIDEDTGAKRDEIILLDILHQYPDLLRYKTLSWFVHYFIT